MTCQNTLQEKASEPLSPSHAFDHDSAIYNLRTFVYTSRLTLKMTEMTEMQTIARTHAASKNVNDFFREGEDKYY